MKFILLTLWAATFGRQTVTACNIAEGTSPTGRKTMVAETAVPTRYLFATPGTAPGSAVVCDASKKPLGLFTDTTTEAGTPLAVDLLGAIQGTRLVVAGAAIAKDDAIGSDASGKAIPAAAGKWCAGKALNAAAAGELVEFVPAFPHKV